MIMEESKVAVLTSSSSSSSGGFRKCGRWNPTSEQVKVLTDLFRSGLRTPTTDQIQSISSQLSFYGKIESKNVFYWFQNHKARERHKRRKIHYNSNPKPDEEGDDGKKTESSSVVMETLQLFPLKSAAKNDHHTHSQMATFNIQLDHPHLLDLRLSTFIL